MSFSSTTDRVTFAGNGVTTAFSFPYLFISNSDLVVVSKLDSTGAETTKTITTHYTVTGAGVSSGGTVTYLTAPPTGTTVIIYRDKAAIQELSLNENGKIPAESLETQLDKLAMMVQRVKNKLARSIGLKEGFVATFDPSLPALMVNDGYFKTSSDGSALEYVAQADLINTISAGAQAFTASRALVSDTSGLATSSATTATEIGYVNGVTSQLSGNSQAATYTNKSINSDNNTITNIKNADIKASAAIDATKIADGSVTSAEFQYINTLSSNAQTQIDAKQTRSVLTTKGDLYIATASDTVARQGVGSNDQVLVADSSQTNGVAYHTELDASHLKNVSIAASVASNALTISLKTSAGSDASATDPIKIAFRSATLTSGVISLVKTTGALSTVISSGSTAGHSNAVEGFIYVYAINNAGSIELAWSSRYYDENVLFTTTAEGGAGAADSATAIYSTTARTNVAGRLIGRLISTQTTAGTWAAVPTNIQVGSVGKIMSSQNINARVSGNPASATVGNTIIWPTVDWDTHSAYSSGLYTAPIAGKYRISGFGSGGAASITLSACKNGTTDVDCGFTDATGRASFVATVSVTAGQTISLEPSGTLDFAAGFMTIERVGD